MSYLDRRDVRRTAWRLGPTWGSLFLSACCFIAVIILAKFGFYNGMFWTSLVGGILFLVLFIIFIVSENVSGSGSGSSSSGTVASSNLGKIKIQEKALKVANSDESAKNRAKNMDVIRYSDVPTPNITVDEISYDINSISKIVLDEKKVFFKYSGKKVEIRCRCEEDAQFVFDFLCGNK